MINWQTLKNTNENGILLLLINYSYQVLDTNASNSIFNGTSKREKHKFDEVTLPLVCRPDKNLHSLLSSEQQRHAEMPFQTLEF